MSKLARPVCLVQWKVGVASRLSGAGSEDDYLLSNYVEESTAQGWCN